MKSFEQVSQARLINIGDKRVPSILIGTSPFIGASQFGLKAKAYYKGLYQQPRNMTEIITKAIDLGILGVQLMLDKVIVDAVLEAEKERGIRLAKLVTIGISNLEEEFRLLEELKPEVAFIHAQISDTLDMKVLEELINRIKKRGVIPGLATHRAARTIEWMEKNELDFATYLAPVNRDGKFMGKDSKYVLDLIKATKKCVIAKKVLAAGKLSPNDALAYVKSIENVKGIAIGIASIKEAEETLSLAKKFFGT
jgi:hypothetical protein